MHVPDALADGSSPLTRGKRGWSVDTIDAWRLIPAHAGKTYEAHALAIQTGAHPRSRGENGALGDIGGSEVGSSPLTRGKLGTVTGTINGFRLIPAHAGKTSTRYSPGHRTAAHPRSRGENRSTFGEPISMRWLIPAHAGKTRPMGSSCRQARAHPRSRGENERGPACPTRQSGSSPLTRGKRVPVVVDTVPRGLIPAHAGKTTT